MRQTLITLIAVPLFAVSSFAPASNGGGSDRGSFTQPKIDQQYELGKSYYKSRQADGTRLEYCIKTGDAMKKLSRKSVKRFKKGPTSDFVDSLYNCNDPNIKISDVVADGQGDAILYYLNKRFKLRLKDG